MNHLRYAACINKKKDFYNQFSDSKEKHGLGLDSFEDP